VEVDLRKHDPGDTGPCGHRGGGLRDGSSVPVRGELPRSVPVPREKTPSFYVHPARQAFKCFGCGGGGGSVFHFLMKARNLSFADSVEELAERFGVRSDTREGPSVPGRKRISTPFSASRRTRTGSFLAPPPGRRGRNFCGGGSDSRSRAGVRPRLERHGRGTGFRAEAGGESTRPGARRQDSCSHPGTGLPGTVPGAMCFFPIGRQHGEVASAGFGASGGGRHARPEVPQLPRVRM